MKGATRRKVVTSGRLTGGAKVHVARKAVLPNAAPAACPEAAYSLFSTDSEDQVTTLHKGLDRCAALLSGILQDDTAASPSFPRTKSRPSTSLGKKSIKKLPTKTAAQRSSQSGQGGPSSGTGTSTPRTSHRSSAPAAHSGVKLHPPWKRPQSQLQSHHVPASCSTTLSRTNPPAQSQRSVLWSVVQSSSRSGRLPVPQAEADTVRPCSAECDFVPVRDVNNQSTGTDTHTSVVMSNTQLEPGQGAEVAQGRDLRNDVKVKTVHFLLEELKALIGGQGSVAEMVLGYLQPAESSPQVNDGSEMVPAGPEMPSPLSQNSQLCRIYEQQLKEKAETRQKVATLCNSEESTLQEELATAQVRLQELQGDLAELRKALQDTRRQLSDREAESRAMKTELETTRSRWVESEREKSKLAALAQQRLEEIENLNRIFQSHDSSDSATVVDCVSDARLTSQQQHWGRPAGPPTDHITHYLMSLEPLHPTEQVHRATDGDRLLDPDVECERSDWSVRSESTFDTKDEAAFRDGLAALDASIASLQKTIKLDLRR